MKKKIKYTDEPMDNVKVIEDFLPAPNELIFKDKSVLENQLGRITLDNDILEWFKSHSKDYQNQINSILRNYIKSNA
ncbi:MAG: BrnA antitoxin family protein [Desulfamplus sp.]|nr:BrnA antitoxin family protein [Desulfamplus sp.]